MGWKRSLSISAATLALVMMNAPSHAQSQLPKSEQEMVAFLSGAWGDADTNGNPDNSTDGVNCSYGHILPKDLTNTIPASLIHIANFKYAGARSEDRGKLTKGSLLFFTKKDGLLNSVSGKRTGTTGYRGRQIKEAVIGQTDLIRTKMGVLLNLPTRSKPFKLVIVDKNHIRLSIISSDPFDRWGAEYDYYRCSSD